MKENEPKKKTKSGRDNFLKDSDSIQQLLQKEGMSLDQLLKQIIKDHSRSRRARSRQKRSGGTEPECKIDIH